MHYKILVGAHAYVCVTDGDARYDIRLYPGHGVAASLRMYATMQRNEAAKAIERAERAERLVAQIEKEKESEQC